MCSTKTSLWGTQQGFSASVASILFGQPMFIVLCLFISRRLASFMFSY